MPSRFIPCPNCHLNTFNVTQDRDTGELWVVCANCQDVVFHTEEPVTSAVAAGPTQAPSGGPLRQ